MLTEEIGSATRRIDVLTLLDQLQDLVETSTKLPLSDRIVVSQEVVLDFVDAIRNILPHDVIEADRILKDRQRIIEAARDKAEQILEDASEQSRYLTDEHQVARAAELKADKLVNQAQREAEEIMASADEYVQKLFGRMEDEALRVAGEIRTSAARSG